MPQNPFMTDFQPAQSNPFIEDAKKAKPVENPFMVQKPFDPTEAPTKNALGRLTDPIIDAGKSTVNTLLAAFDTPQNALQGAVVEGLQGNGIGHGFMQGLTRAKDYQGTDVLDAAGWKGEGLGKKAAGLALDLVGDPLNLVGVGELKDAYQGLVKGGAAIADSGIRKVPGLGTVYKAAESFIDPHAALKEVDGLKDFARLNEMKARALKNQQDELIA